MSECTRKRCKLSGEEIPALNDQTSEDRCGNCDHHAELHNDEGCTVRIQQKGSNKNEPCPCNWSRFEASDVRRASQKGDSR